MRQLMAEVFVVCSPSRGTDVAEADHQFCAVQLVEAGIAKVPEVCAAFKLSSRTFSRWRTSLRKEEIAGLVAEKFDRTGGLFRDKKMGDKKIGSPANRRAVQGKSLHLTQGTSPPKHASILRDGVPPVHHRPMSSIPVLAYPSGNCSVISPP